MKEESSFEEDNFMHLRLYIIKKKEIIKKAETIIKIKRFLNPFLICLLTVILLNSHSKERGKFTENDIFGLLKQILNKSRHSLVIDSLSDYRTHIFNFFNFSNDPGNYLFHKIKRDNLEVKLYFRNENNLSKSFFNINLNKKKSFSINNISQILNLPFDMSSLENFTKFIDPILSLELQLVGMQTCIQTYNFTDKPLRLEECYDFSIFLKYINHDHVITSLFDCDLNIISKKIFSNNKIIKLDKKNIQNQYFNSSNNQIDIYFIFNLILLFFSCFLIILEIIYYYLVIKNKKFENYFKLSKIFYKENYDVNMQSKNKKQIKINIYFYFSLLSNISIVYHYLSQFIFLIEEYEVIIKH